MYITEVSIFFSAIFNGVVFNFGVVFVFSKGPQADHVTWIQGNSKEHYWTAYETYSRSDTVTAFRRREDMVPWNLSRYE